MTPRSLDDLLNDAEILHDTYTDDDIADSRLRIEREIANTWWSTTLLLESSAQQAQPWCSPSTPYPRTHTAQDNQAAHTLQKLSMLVISDSRAARHIALLAQSCRAEPASALIFACLLHLADKEGAQFWWQFSAGAGSPTAAICLYLLHLQRNEPHTAEHWAQQAEHLERLEIEERDGNDIISILSRPPSRGDDTLWYTPYAMIERTMAILHSGIAAHTHVLDSPTLATQPLRHSIAAAVQRLEAQSDADYGTIPTASSELAARLQDSAATQP